jgi:heat shock protein HslJ
MAISHLLAGAATRIGGGAPAGAASFDLAMNRAGSLSGQWRVVAIGGERVSGPRLNFDGKGGLSGYDGVNRFGGTYSTRGGQLRVTGGPATMMAGSPAAMTRAQRLHGILENAASWRVENGRLTIRARDGSSIVATR